MLIAGCLTHVDAQQSPKKEILAYNFKYPQQLIDSRDSADYVRYLIPADSLDKKNYYTVKEYYKNGIIKFEGHAFTNSINPVYDGMCMEYFSTGKRRALLQYQNGHLIGPIFLFYPNGVLYTENIR